MVRRCRVAYVNGADIGLQLSKARVGGGGNVFISCFFTFILVLSSLSLSLISCTISSISFLPFSGR